MIQYVNNTTYLKCSAVWDFEALVLGPPFPADVCSEPGALWDGGEVLRRVNGLRLTHRWTSKMIHEVRWPHWPLLYNDLGARPTGKSGD